MAVWVDQRTDRKQGVENLTSWMNGRKDETKEVGCISLANMLREHIGSRKHRQPPAHGNLVYHCWSAAACPAVGTVWPAGMSWCPPTAGSDLVSAQH